MPDMPDVPDVPDIVEVREIRTVPGEGRVAGTLHVLRNQGQAAPNWVLGVFTTAIILFFLLVQLSIRSASARASAVGTNASVTLTDGACSSNVASVADGLVAIMADASTHGPFTAIGASP